MTGIRVIDIGPIGLDVGEPSSDALLRVGRDLVSSFSSTGFAYLSHHGISQQLQDDTFAIAKRFFDLSAEQKLQYERFVKTGYTGYTPIAGDNSTNASDPAAGVTDVKECFDMRCLSDPVAPGVAPLLGPQLQLLGDAGRRLSLRLLAALDAALGSGQQLTGCHQRQLQEGGWTVLRLLHYPAMKEGAVTEDSRVTRCGAHTDFSTLTLLFQHGVGGLEVEASDGEWMRAEPIPGTILVNIGDILQVMTSGRLRATNHRVPLPVSTPAPARQSIALFVQPDQGTTVAPLDGDPRYQPIDFDAFIRNMFATVYPTYSVSESMAYERITG